MAFWNRGKQNTGDKAAESQQAEVKAETKPSSKSKPKTKSTKKPTAKAKKDEAIKVDHKNTNNAYKVLQFKLETEQTVGMSKLNQYVFMVEKSATKQSVKQAIESVYGVHVQAVNIMNYDGKRKSFRQKAGQRKSFKKAIVTIKDGETID